MPLVLSAGPYVLGSSSAASLATKCGTYNRFVPFASDPTRRRPTSKLRTHPGPLELPISLRLAEDADPLFKTVVISTLKPLGAERAESCSHTPLEPSRPGVENQEAELHRNPKPQLQHTSWHPQSKSSSDRKCATMQTNWLFPPSQVFLMLN